MTLMFCGIGRLWISGIAELPRHVVFAMFGEVVVIEAKTDVW